MMKCDERKRMEGKADGLALALAKKMRAIHTTATQFDPVLVSRWTEWTGHCGL
jgi:hypothetical protein